MCVYSAVLGGSCGAQTLVTHVGFTAPRPGTETKVPCIAWWVLNHWTPRAIPERTFKKEPPGLCHLAWRTQPGPAVGGRGPRRPQPRGSALFCRPLCTDWFPWPFVSGPGFRERPTRSSLQASEVGTGPISLPSCRGDSLSRGAGPQGRADGPGPSDSWCLTS